ncbi:MAG: hypothetical protein RLZZ519_1606 [Bacteroidota bacterium]|jgi:hypothetical protein
MRARLLLYCLVGLLLFQSAGYYLAFVLENTLHKAITKAEVRRGEDEELVVLHLSESEFKSLAWVEKDEFWYDGAMHDVKAVHRSDDGSWLLHCKRDHHETEMLRRGNKAMHAENEDSENHSTGQTLRILAPCVLGDVLDLPESTITSQEFPVFQECFQGIVQDIVAPPPQRA